MKPKPKTIEELLQLRESIHNELCFKDVKDAKNDWNRLGQIEDTLQNKHHIKRKYTYANNNSKR